MTIVNRNMKMLDVRVTTRINSVSLFSFFFRPNLFIKDKVLDASIFFEFFKDNSTIYSIIRVMGEVDC